MKKSASITWLVALVLVWGSMNFLEAKTEGQFVGSINSDVYHYPSCTYAKKIKPENQIWFTDADDAVRHGYRPCSVCNPPMGIPEMTPLYFLIASTVIGSTVVVFRKKRAL